MTDLFIGPDTATATEAAAVDAVIDDPAVDVITERLVRSGAQRAKARRHLLLPALHALHDDVGWISKGGLNYIADQLQVPPAEAYGVATFYDMFEFEPTNHDVEYCDDIACRIASPSTDGIARPCLGRCEQAPAVLSDGISADPVRRAGPLLRRAGVVDPTSLESYRSHGGFSALERAKELGPAAVVEAVKTSGLSGRGGAAFPTGVKWEAVAGQDVRPHYVVANADESEPGTFKDRVLMELDPFSLIEALTIAGFACGADQGWIYIRGEYPGAAAGLEGAIEQCRSDGVLDGFDIQVRRGAGAYICGEETALFNSIEGFRGEPRNKPPFPTTHGLFNKPTAINNVETLVNVLDIVTDGADSWSPGTRIFCLSGRIRRPGVYELDHGTTLGAAIDLAGGVSGDLRAILLGGAAGSFVGPETLDLPLTQDAARAAGVSLGSGVIMCFDTTVDMGDIVARIARFFADESCGQCVPCRVGTTRQQEALSQDRRDLIDPIARVMRDASICGLGHTASGAIESALSLGLIDA